MFTPHEELGRITHERLAREARAARLAKSGRPGIAQRAVQSTGESFISLGNWLKRVSQREPASEMYEIRFNI